MLYVETSIVKVAIQLVVIGRVLLPRKKTPNDEYDCAPHDKTDGSMRDITTKYVVFSINIIENGGKKKCLINLPSRFYYLVKNLKKKKNIG
ncbi:hypothetical protein BT10792_31280 (plasmid) [Bacillus thuringiensis]|nr:hypothetical protein BT10792_31280 [Bacillus thuringiensis]